MKIKKTLCLLLCLCLLGGLFPAGALAAEAPACTHHSHDEGCGEGGGSCVFVCESCAATLQSMVDALSEPEDVTLENVTGAVSALEAIDAFKVTLSQKTLDKVDWGTQPHPCRTA